MAIYKYGHYLTQNNSVEFDVVTHPANKTPYSGIYRCEGCGQNIASVEGHTMPPTEPSPAYRHARYNSVEADSGDSLMRVGAS